MVFDHGPKGDERDRPNWKKFSWKIDAVSHDYHPDVPKSVPIHAVSLANEITGAATFPSGVSYEAQV